MTKLRDTTFWAHVDVSAEPDACWEWTGTKNGTGKNAYGRFKFNGRWERAHRLVWADRNGAIPDGMFVCHHCDNPPCVNPAHLFLGTATDNNRDMMRKGRFRGGSPEKLDRNRVIRNMVAEGMSLREVAAIFGVHHSRVHQVVHGRNR